jgi:hypothetical protein
LKEILHEHKAKYDTWILLLLLIPVCILVYITITVAMEEESAGLTTILINIVIIGLLWLIMPRKYIIMDDRLKVVLGTPLFFYIPFSNIKEIKKPEGITFGINFGTSSSTILSIVLIRGSNINIAPDSRETFMKNMDKAMQEWRRNTNKHD